MQMLGLTLLVGVVIMDIKVNDVVEFSAGETNMRILITYVDHDISGESLNDVGAIKKGRFMSFTKKTFDKMVADGMLKKVGHRPKGVSYT
jgi:hypothetical protein